MIGGGRHKIVVLGMMSKIPVAGVVWQTVHYLLGLERLGYETYYVEAHARTPSMLMTHADDDSGALAARFISDVLSRFDLGDHWAFHALHDDGRCYGLTRRELSRLYADAALILNLHGGTEPQPEHAASGRLVYLETDPVQLQIELHDGCAETVRFLDPHVAFFTFAENYGNSDCRLPMTSRYEFWPTRQPVVTELWSHGGVAVRPEFTTVASWSQPWREVVLEGESYHWSKDREFLKYLELPRLTGQRIELALAGCGRESRRLLEDHGWAVREASEISDDIDGYRSYVIGSRAEFTVAKDQNVRLRTGWFSDRSATYLASGRPVVTQETGFSNVLPTGSGLFGFTSIEEAAEAIDNVNAGYGRASRAAHDVAEEYFRADVVLGSLLERLGLPVRTRGGRDDRARQPFSDELCLVPTSKRPMVLVEDTVRAVLQAPRPEPTTRHPHDRPVRASVVVIAFGSIVFTRLCLDTVMSTVRADDEVIVVDNGSDAAGLAYLEALSRADPRVRLIVNGRNLGFAAAANVGLACARGRVLVLLNNDTITPPGWLDGLCEHVSERTVGLVTPCTNAAPGEARIDTTYRTLGEMIAVSRERAQALRGRSFTVSTVTMFCCALRRDVFERVGQIDERFEVGMFEDDDYARRVHASGFELRCAEDVFVHHFGEASFGTLVPSGEHAAIFAENRRRLEEKWGAPWTPHGARASPTYESLRSSFRRLVERAVPAGCDVLVVSRGDSELCRLTGPRAHHFPADAHGAWAGYHPGDTAEVLSRLDVERHRGIRFIALPATALWWLDFYRGLREHLTDVDGDEAGAVFSLRGGARQRSEDAAPAAAPSRVRGAAALDEGHTTT